MKINTFGGADAAIVLAIVDFSQRPEIGDLWRVHESEIGAREFGQIFTNWEFALSHSSGAKSYAVLNVVLDRPVMESFKLEFEIERDAEVLAAILKYRWLAITDTPENWERSFSFEVCGLEYLATMLHVWLEVRKGQQNKQPPKGHDPKGYRRKPKN